ncbi:MAG: hypothetical protein JWM68_4226, partial [Verrucomicrobiales bacterium]|nr:hypothetical protein [Verrucomicrobiales bacterium]
MESYTIESFSEITGFDWEELLKQNRAIILGEAGSGKSWELRERTRLLNERGEFAFFIRLDQLVDRQLQDLFDQEDASRFVRWKQSGKAAYFFLDSVDEAKFRKISDFHATLNRFRIDVGPELIFRAKLYLSSRISEWKPLTDGFEFQRLFPIVPFAKRNKEGQSTEIQRPKDNFSIVQLEPLDRKQVERFASANKVDNVQAFVRAIDKAFAWEFARRPLDVADLINFWKANGRVGSLTELIRFDLLSKLSPREGRDEFPLSEAEAREGAEWLGAASVFSRKFSFDVPDDNPASIDSLNLRACLPPHWRDDQIRALLNRAIFDGAVYGQFRFHHRRVGEYLAAMWITNRLEKGCPHYVLEDLLVEIVRGRKVLRPSLRPIAAWLCCGNKPFNQFVRTLVLETHPNIHLLYGDPSALSLDYRRQVLVSLSNMSRARQRI